MEMEKYITKLDPEGPDRVDVKTESNIFFNTFFIAKFDEKLLFTSYQTVTSNGKSRF